MLKYASDSRRAVSLSGARTLFRRLTTETGSVGEIITPNMSATARGMPVAIFKTRPVMIAEITTPNIARLITVFSTVLKVSKTSSHSCFEDHGRNNETKYDGAVEWDAL